jgi:hypothetical protein
MQWITHTAPEGLGPEYIFDFLDYEVVVAL